MHTIGIRSKKAPLPKPGSIWLPWRLTTRVDPERRTTKSNDSDVSLAYDGDHILVYLHIFIGNKDHFEVVLIHSTPPARQHLKHASFPGKGQGRCGRLLRLVLWLDHLRHLPQTPGWGLNSRCFKSVDKPFGS